MHSRNPWSGRHLIGLAVAYTVALLLVGVGTYGAGGTGDQDEGVRWLAVSVAGLVIGGVANGLWLSWGRYRVAVTRHVLVGAHRPAPRWTSGRTSVVGPVSAAELPVTHPESTRYHREHCELVRGRQLSRAAREQHEAQGRHACEVCEP